MVKKGYNLFVTGQPGSGRLSTVRKLLSELADKSETPCDICYVNNFKQPEAPVMLRFKSGEGSRFKKDMQDFLDVVKRGGAAALRERGVHRPQEPDCRGPRKEDHDFLQGH